MLNKIDIADILAKEITYLHKEHTTISNNDSLHFPDLEIRLSKEIRAIIELYNKLN